MELLGDALASRNGSRSRRDGPVAHRPRWKFNDLRRYFHSSARRRKLALPRGDRTERLTPMRLPRALAPSQWMGLPGHLHPRLHGGGESAR